MAKRVYFAFHYQDVVDFRANVVRNHWLTKKDREDAGFFDASLWEESKKKGTVALKRLINSGLNGTSVTCVLIGSDTFRRPWVRYELLKSFQRGNTIVGVHINSIPGRDKQTKPLGPNPLEYVGVTFSDSGLVATLHQRNTDKWTEYDEIDGTASYKIDPVSEKYRGNGYNLSHFFSTYDWVSDDGFNNFASWV